MKMPPWLTAATRMTHSGDLQGATAAIQAVLTGVAQPAAPSKADVIDITARVIDSRAHVIDEPAPQSNPPRQEAPQTRPTNAASPAGTFVAASHTAAGLTRAYKLFLPGGTPSSAPRALVVMLHGCTQDPDDFAAGTGMNEAAQAHGIVVMYPAQDASANPARCWNWFKHNHQARDRGEPAFLASLTRTVMAQHDIDPQRVYVAGLSAGGAMAAILGRAYPELFAAVGVHSGLAAGAAHDMPSAFAAMRDGAPAAQVTGLNGPGAAGGPPTIVFHGDADSTVHPLNGEQVASASAGPGANTQASQTPRRRSAQAHACTRQVYTDDAGRPVAEHWTVHGSGHAWSGGHPQGSYTDADGPDATAEMLRFFLEHPLRRPLNG